MTALNMDVSLASSPGAADPPAALAGPAPGPARRLAARFALLAFGLYHLPLIVNDYPSLGGGGFRDEGLSRAWGHVFGQLGLWIARHVFGVTRDMSAGLSGDNGDTVEEYCRLLAGVVIAAIAATIWTLADRRRPRAAWVEDWLRVLLRYSIALGLASYGMAKLYPVQFGQLAATSLETRVGELTPFGLLWRFMEYSPVYNTFAGIMEMIVVVLLCFRRTTTLGALICLPVMANVALMNLCFDVPVKLFSTMVVVSAAVLVLYDARALVDLLVRRPATRAPSPDPAPRSRRVRWARRLVAFALVGGVILSSAIEMDRLHGLTLAEDASPAHGTWQVGSFVQGGRELAGTADPARWRRFIVSARGVAIRLEDDSLVRCQHELDGAARTLQLTCPQRERQGAHVATLHWTRTGDELRLEGTCDGLPLTASLTRRDEAQLPLLSSRFSWTMD
jgi:hypothetical protein